ncbi:MAG TPA: arsenate reductase ArsC [Telluria sp.]|nr:arsenate reductase ArsC [Telluria sp.]
MTNKTYNILFVCTGNSARSVMSEALATILSGGRLVGFSAGSRPVGRVNPFAVEQIQRFAPDYPVAGMRSKSWDEFALPDAPHMDFIVTVCDNAAGETCPYWPGHPATAHWGYEDPGGADDEAKRASFAKVFGQIKQRMEAFVALPLEQMDDAAIRAAIQRIGEMPV